MITPLFLSIALISVLVHMRYGEERHKHFVRLFLSTLLLFWSFIELRLNNDSGSDQRQDYSTVASSVSRDETYSKRRPVDCDAPITLAERNSVGCNGGCVSLGFREVPRECNYYEADQCVGTFEKQLQRLSRLAYARNHSFSGSAGTEEPPKFDWPARGKVIQKFSEGKNDGINIALYEGTPIKAAEDGEVAYSGNELPSYGNMILVRHADGYVTAYSHNSKLLVQRGDRVTRGQEIAKSGRSGAVRAPQLHFELRRGQTPVDPMTFLEPNEG